jgi:hypothetical protein
MQVFTIALCLAIFMLILTRNESEPKGPAEYLQKVDHLVYGTPDLNRGIEEIEKLLGVRATPGGKHPGRGTHNALLGLGPTTYLEIIAPDPEQPQPKTPRPFGLDGLKQPGLIAWAAKGIELDELTRDAARKGVRLGEVTSGSRQRPDGVVLSWRYTNPQTVVAEGIVPFFIDWGQSPHPAQTAAGGLSLVDMRAEHPDAVRIQNMLRELGIDMPVKRGSRPQLIAVIKGPRGRVELR